MPRKAATALAALLCAAALLSGAGLAHADEGEAHASGGEPLPDGPREAPQGLAEQLRLHPYAHLEAASLSLLPDGWEATEARLRVPLPGGGELRLWAARARLLGGALRLEGVRVERPQAPALLEAEVLELRPDGTLHGQGLRAPWPDGWGGQPAELRARAFASLAGALSSRGSRSSHEAQGGRCAWRPTPPSCAGRLGAGAC